MRKLSLKNYKVEVMTEKGTEFIDYQVVQSLINVLFHPELQLGGMALLEQNELAGKILVNDGKEILLEDSEYAKVKQPFDIIKGFGKNDVELVRRILQAETVEVAEKKP